MDELLIEFLTESTEGLNQLDNELVTLEKNPNDQNILQSIFRTMHTIKGTCGFIGLPRLEKVTHAGENVLGRIRDGKIDVSPIIISVILEAIDAVKSIITVLSETGTEPEGNDSDLIERLNQISDAADNGAAPPQEESQELPQEFPPEISQTFDSLVTLEQTISIVADEPKHVTESVPPPPQQEAAPKVAPGEAENALAANQTVRVNVNVLENLMTRVSELVLTRNQLVQTFRNIDNNDVAVSLHRLNHVTSELQEEVMKTRMQPIGNAWTKIPRLVRDLTQETKKKIELEMIGAETELDRQVIEMIKDPLTHMIRNSADHGLEMPDERVQKGKSETGKITLRAFHAGGHIIIEISDDGKGLPVDKIKEKAISTGLATYESLLTMSESQIYQFIFKAGFSTAAKVTNISGRGVGMDVVRSNVEKIGGTIEVKSQLDKGSTFTIKIPLTLAIVSALVAEIDGYKFSIPQLSVLELVKVANHTEHQIELVHDKPVLRLRNKLLPLIDLRTLLRIDQMPPEMRSPEYKERGGDDLEDVYIIVLQVGADVFGVIVTQVYDTQEIVVKPVSELIRQVPIYGGNTILGDGSVIMILDPNGLSNYLGAHSLMDEAKTSHQDAIAKKRANSKDTFLLFHAEDETPKAVPLSAVDRLEKIDMSTIEFSDGLARIQYRNTLIPLVSLSSSYSLSREGRKPVLVFSNNKHSIGLVVDQILDIMEDVMDIKIKASGAGKIGSVILNGQATDIIDVEHYIQMAYPDWRSLAKTDQNNRQKVIYIGDLAYGASIFTPLLQLEGYDVDKFETLEEALSFLQEVNDCCAVFLDIEKPCKDFVAPDVSIHSIKQLTPLPLMTLADSDQLAYLDKNEKAIYCNKFNRQDFLQTLVQVTRSNPEIVSLDELEFKQS